MSQNNEEESGLPELRALSSSWWEVKISPDNQIIIRKTLDLGSAVKCAHARTQQLLQALK